MSTKEIKGNLARLLATENLIVEHRKVPTASFDVDRRVLTLPMWDKASDVVFDMLVGHEVGHALFTPNEDWRDIADCPKDFVNVIEDARIEKLMKRKYPGLRKSFAGGYQELNDRDFFSIANEDIDSFSLIDRINLHFKIGASAMIPFSIEEQVFVARTDVAETFEEVLQIAVDVHNFSNKTETVAEIPVQPDQSENESNSDEQTVQQTEEQSSEETDQPNTESSTGASSSGADLEDVRDDWYDEDGNLMDDEGGSEGGDTSETQRAFDNASENLSSRHVNNPIYVEIPNKIDLDKHVVDWTTLHDWIDSQAYEAEKYEEVDSKYLEFRKQSQKEVNYLVKEFECRKSADAYARAGQSKTGVLDTSKLHTYKYNEDLFKKVTIVPDGKNHGLIFILDWSGSMANELLPTVKQLLNLTAFCKKVQIPFEVYAFTNEWVVAQRAMNPDDFNEREYGKDAKKNTVHIDEYFHLMNFISSRSNARDYERMCKNLWREASVYRNYTGYQASIGLQLSGTPLNESIILLNYMIPEFKKQNDLQKVNVCILSDGEGCAIGYGHEIYLDHKDEYVVRLRRLDYYQTLRDRETGITYKAFDYDNITNTFIQQVRDRNPGVNVIGFRILSGNQLASFVGRYAVYENYHAVQKQWKKEKSAIIPNPIAYSALYAISNNALNESTEFNVESGAKKGDISRAFKKMLSSKSNNKKLLSSFIGYVS
tara:strand:+ start:235 stop:2370 length:2136 start_codon:yes stop_codon:yes gene_type:complete